MGKLVECVDHTFSERNPTFFAVLSLRKYNLPPFQIDIAPIKPKRLTDTRAGVNEKNNQRSQVIGTGFDQSVRFVQREPSNRTCRYLGPVYEYFRTPFALGGVVENR
jgi:hypothetical protein